LAAFGIDCPDTERGPVFDQTALAIDAAAAGQGIALARTALASLDLIAGRLVRPLEEAIPAEFAYWIVCRKSAADSPSSSAHGDRAGPG
jgi:LysR family glycine cleavage system transcriptional activator